MCHVSGIRRRQDEGFFFFIKDNAFFIILSLFDCVLVWATRGRNRHCGRNGDSRHWSSTRRAFPQDHYHRELQHPFHDDDKYDDHSTEDSTLNRRPSCGSGPKTTTVRSFAIACLVPSSPLLQLSWLLLLLQVHRMDSGAAKTDDDKDDKDDNEEEYETNR